MITMSKALFKEFDFYIKNQKDLVKKYNGKIIVIKDKKILGAYDSEIEALEETVKTEKLGSFIVQKVEPGEESYTQTYHSRVAFK